MTVASVNERADLCRGDGTAVNSLATLWDGAVDLRAVQARRQGVLSAQRRSTAASSGQDAGLRPEPRYNLLTARWTPASAAARYGDHLRSTANNEPSPRHRAAGRRQDPVSRCLQQRCNQRQHQRCYDANGTLDASFGSSGIKDDPILWAAPTTTSDIAVLMAAPWWAATRRSAASTPSWPHARNSSGPLDTSFNGTGKRHRQRQRRRRPSG